MLLEVSGNNLLFPVTMLQFFFELQAEWRSGRDEGDMMDCLIKHKNEVDVREDYKCRAAIEHFQLISLKNYHFTYKFKEACRTYVMRFCPTSKTK